MQKSVVRIRKANGQVVGAGFLVAERWVLTCAHVIRDALELDETPPRAPQADVYLDFPLVNPAHTLGARVIAWQPEQDVAGLELSGDSPLEALPARLVAESELWGHDLRVFGFSEHYQDIGLWRDGTLLARNAAGWVQITSKKETDHFIQPGFSGAPVWAEALGGVVGMVVAADLDPQNKAAFIIPVDALVAAWPALGEWVSFLEAERRAYLEAVVRACEHIRLPATAGAEARPTQLERVYVALKADRSSPAERRASHAFFGSLVEERRAARGGNYWRVVREVARLNPQAARFLQYNEQFAALFEPQEAERALYLAEIVRRQRWLVLLGGPGSGKTTLARWLALQMARAFRGRRKETVQIPAQHVRPDADPQALEGLGLARLPLLVRVADYAAARWPREQDGQDTHLSLLDYVRAGAHLAGWLTPGSGDAVCRALVDDCVAHGRALFILDGLDEVTDTAQRHEIVAEIVQLIEMHVRDAQGRAPWEAGLARADEPAQGGGNQLVVTSRIVGYQVRPLPAELPHFVIQPMDDTAVRRFCGAWAEARGAPERAEALQAAVLEHANPQVRDEMARNPLLLTVLAQVFEISQGRLPARRAELYGQAARAVFDQRRDLWKGLAAGLGGRDFRRVMMRLTARLAWELHANPDYPASLAEEESVHGWLAEAVAEERALSQTRRAEDVVEDALRAARELSGFFIARGQGVYGFVHRQFQEYFAAQALVGRKDAQGAFLERLDDPAWREVLLLATALLGPRAGQRTLEAVLDAPDPTAGLLPHNTLFVAAALRELARPPAGLVGRVARELIAAYRRDDEGRFAALQGRVERAFGALPRRVGQGDPVGEALCAAIQTSEVWETSEVWSAAHSASPTGSPRPTLRGSAPKARSTRPCSAAKRPSSSRR